ncbi:MAG: hypothetical protein Q4G04_05400 [bacterium]|nr:hypothetical protein [bacterium]
MLDNDIIQEEKEFVYKDGNTTITIIRPRMTVAEKRTALKNVYDTIHKIARECEQRGVDTSDWFYTEEEIESMKKDKKYIFI